MITSSDNFDESLGKEPIELFGFSSEEELNHVLLPLMEEIPEKINS